MIKKHWLLCFLLIPSTLAAQTSDGESQKWNTAGLRQANSMGGGEAPIPKRGKFRVFVLMGQSNMQGAARASELKPPYNQKHDRIRIWANGRWEYFVPRNRFGPGVSMAHQLADFWPRDTIGVIKVASGGTGIRGFEKNWSFERANRTFDGKKGSLYKDLMNAVAMAQEISQPEFGGFVWKQGAADGTKRDLAEEYFDSFKLLVSDLRQDLSRPDLPVFVLTYLADEELLKLKKKPTGKRAHLGTVLMADNRAGREIPYTTTVHHGMLPVGADGVHLNAKGQLMLGEMTAAAVEELYKAKEVAETKQTLAAINDRFVRVEVELVEWPDELHQQLGKLKKIAFMATPVKKPAGKMPLLIALHGAGGRTISLQEQLARSAEVKGLRLAELAGRDLILLEPNTADVWDAGSLNTMLDYVLKTFEQEIDENRVYVMGHSMGGWGTWTWINESPQRFAAAAPCGFPAEETGDAERLVSLPIWGMAGGDDGPRTTGVKRMVERLREAGNKNVKHTEFAGANHSEANAKVFSSVELVDWMLELSRE